jgi:acetyl esterase/lipase
VVFFYGGSWKWGDRADYAFAGQALTSRGWLAVIPDYRTYPEARFPDFVEDGAQALRWVKDNIAGYGGDPAQVWLAGHSAGGHIAELLALDARYLAAVGMRPGDLKGAAALAAPAAFDPLRYASVRPIFAGMADPQQARPIVHVDGDEPPLLLLHGGDDDTVYPSNSAALAARIREAGGRVRHVVYPGMGHFGILLALAAPFRHGESAAVLDDIARFVEAE